MSGLGKRVNSPSATMVLAPPPPSSAGWATNMTVPLHWSFMSSERLGHRHPDSHVDVVAAGMRHRRLDTAQHLLGRAGIGEPGLLRQGQGVELGAHHHGGTRPVPVEGDDAGLADAFGYLVVQRPHLRGEPGRRSRLLEAELGMAMDVLVERLDVGILGIEAAIDGGARAGDVGGTSRARRAPATLRGRYRRSTEEISSRSCAFPL